MAAGDEFAVDPTDGFGDAILIRLALSFDEGVAETEPFIERHLGEQDEVGNPGKIGPGLHAPIASRFFDSSAEIRELARVVSLG